MHFFKRRKVIHFDVKSATAARAIFQQGRGAIPKVQFKFLTYDDEEVEFELEMIEAGKMIEQAMSAYNAISPPLKTSRGGFGL